MLRWIIILVCVMMPLAHSPVDAQELTEEQKEIVAEKINRAIDSAQRWLAVVDNEQYTTSWSEASAFFKTKIPDGQWETSLRQVRYPLGKVQSREVKSYQYLTYMPGSPRGEYVVIQFATSFEDKPNAVETVTPMIDSDGQWRIAGYYIN